MFASQCDETKRNLDVRTLLSQVKNAPVNEDFARGQTEAFAPPLGIKGKLNRRCKLAWNIKSAQIFLFACSVNIYSNGLFCFTFELLRAQPCGWLVTKKSRERLAGDVFDAFVTHTGLVCYIINKDSWAQNNSYHSCIFMIFSSNRTRNQTKTCCMNIFVPYLSITTVMLLWFGSPLRVPHINKIER